MEDKAMSTVRARGTGLYNTDLLLISGRAIAQLQQLTSVAFIVFLCNSLQARQQTLTETFFWTEIELD